MVKPHFLAKIYFLKLNEGGRISPIYSGYRPNLKLDTFDFYTCCMLNFIGNEIVETGVHINTYCTVLSPQIIKEHVFVGAKFTLCEGPPRILAHGEIIEVYEM